MIIALPVGLSLVNLINLWRLRPSLLAVDRATADAPPAELAARIEAAMDQHPELKSSSLRPLFSEYKPAVAWWYDVADMAGGACCGCFCG